LSGRSHAALKAVINMALIVLMVTAIRSSILAPLVAAAARLSVGHVKSVALRFARGSRRRGDSPESLPAQSRLPARPSVVNLRRLLRLVAFRSYLVTIKLRRPFGRLYPLNCLIAGFCCCCCRRLDSAMIVITSVCRLSVWPTLPIASRTGRQAACLRD